MRQGTMRGVAVLASLCALAIAGCGGDDDETTSTTTSSTTTTTGPTGPTGPTGDDGAEASGDAATASSIASCLDDEGLTYNENVEFFALEGEPPDADRINVTSGGADSAIVIAVFKSEADVDEAGVEEAGGVVDTEVLGNVVVGIDEDETGNVDSGDLDAVKGCLPS
jgi:hypothetical protein